jgi:histidinol phosphatase-like enzyme
LEGDLFLPGAKKGIAKLTQSGHQIIICTNQAAIALGFLSVDTLLVFKLNQTKGPPILRRAA